MHALLTTLLLSGVCHRDPRLCDLYASKLPDINERDNAKPCRLRQLGLAAIEWVLKSRSISPSDSDKTQPHTDSTAFVEEESSHESDERNASTNCRRLLKPQGLQNSHFVCYQNCILQSLLHLAKFDSYCQGIERIPSELRKLRRSLATSKLPLDAVSLRRSLGHPWDLNSNKGGSAVLFLQTILDRAPNWKKATQIVLNSGCWLSRKVNILWVTPSEGDNLCGLLMERNLRIDEAPQVLIVGLAKISKDNSRDLFAGKLKRMMIPCPLTLKVTTGDGIVTMYQLRATIEEYKGVHVFAHVQCTKDNVWYIANDEDVQILVDESQVVTSGTFLLFYESRP